MRRGALEAESLALGALAAFPLYFTGVVSPFAVGAFHLILLLMAIAPPLAGFVICFFLWFSLSTKAMIFGALWMAIGITVGAWKTHGFRGNLIDFELPPDEA